MNLHLALKTIWTVETDAGPLRLTLKHLERFRCLGYIYLHAPKRGEKEVLDFDFRLVRGNPEPS